MRELKFRIWNGIQFVTKADTYIKTSNGSLWDYEKDYGDTFSSNGKLWSADGKIQQYTGLKDKNGVEIYEGDILHYVFDGASYPKEACDEILTCVWGTQSGLYSFKNKDGEYYWAEIANRCEVIGNVFENSELCNLGD